MAALLAMGVLLVALAAWPLLRSAREGWQSVSATTPLAALPARAVDAPVLATPTTAPADARLRNLADPFSPDKLVSAAAFRFALDDLGFKPRLIEWGVTLRCMLMRLPYGDQGLLMPVRLYRTCGGFRSLPLMEDVDLVRRLGRARTIILRARAVTSAIRYRREGYARRALRNLACLSLFYMRVPAGVIARLYR